jgi:carbon monoxide dehydrogenase subunit G
MELTHRFTVPASIEQAWAAFQDIESVAGCFPGAQVTSVEGDSFTGACKVKLGPIALLYNGSGTFVEKDAAAHRFVVDARGKDKRGNGTAGAKVTASLVDSDGATDVTVVTDLAITGKPAQFGRGVMQDVSDKLLQQFVACLETKVGEPTTTPTSVAEPEVAASVEPTSVAEPEVSAAVEPAPPAVESVPPPPSAEPAPTAPQNDALDLGATVLPVLAKAYWRQALAALVVIVVVIWLLVR